MTDFGQEGQLGRRGSVKQSANGTWTFVVDTTAPGTLARRQTRRRGFATKRAAQAALTKTLRELADQTYVAPQRLSLGEFLQTTWLPAIRSTLRPSTYDSYSRNLRIHVLPKPIAEIRLQDVRAPMLNALYADLLAGETRRALSPRSVAYIHTILHRAFRDAVRWNLLIRNPSDAADPPRPRPAIDRSERTWTSAQVAMFLRLSSGSRYSTLWRLIATTGMRRGEALALRWTDVDLDAGRVSINRALVQSHDYRRAEPGLSFSSPKTSSGRRAISLDSDTVAALRAHRTRQLQERIRGGDNYEHPELVFATRLGQPLHPKVASNLFRKAVAKHGMPYLSIHGLRHTWATLALQAGVHPKVVQERLGHSTIAVTLDIYSHVNPSMDAEAAATVAALLRESR